MCTALCRVRKGDKAAAAHLAKKWASVRSRCVRAAAATATRRPRRCAALHGEPSFLVFSDTAVPTGGQRVACRKTPAIVGGRLSLLRGSNS